MLHLLLPLVLPNSLLTAGAWFMWRIGLSLQARIPFGLMSMALLLMTVRRVAAALEVAWLSGVPMLTVISALLAVGAGLAWRHVLNLPNLVNERRNNNG